MKYVAFLRAINVGGHVVKMEMLRAYFEALGLSNVETFIRTLAEVHAVSRYRPFDANAIKSAGALCVGFLEKTTHKRAMRSPGGHENRDRRFLRARS